jgi:hypothetical protein
VLVNPGNKFYFSQDAVNWLDLEPVTGPQAKKARKLDGAWDTKRQINLNPEPLNPNPRVEIPLSPLE